MKTDTPLQYGGRQDVALLKTLLIVGIQEGFLWEGPSSISLNTVLITCNWPLLKLCVLLLTSSKSYRLKHLN